MIVLATPINVKNLSRLEVHNVSYEKNPERGQIWVDVYCDLGYLTDGEFTAYPDPTTKSSLVYFKFENGMHPERPGMALGRCSDCNEWAFATSGPCTEPGCTGVIEPFMSYNRFRNKIDDSTERDVFNATEAFLINTPAGEGQNFPNPDDISDVRPLIDGS